ncbi:NADH:quinone oxidoreductase I, membrane subunit M [Campylobacter iguaniorum]|uniref:complex I subunit 4 family protein n=1 Tax=Campylobacter iguaniorum TaxID=1244531 RepID=UPI0007C9518A|nr:NADH-quinone oxidoreductase subunit M [Campylobacter iguaniorum]ANE35227.1 NADH:quinone oxidoreductase I, membrane subunit M [Campylobacter iguaniorum]
MMANTLNLMIWTPFIVGILVLLCTDKNGKILALLSSLIVSVFGLVLFYKFDPLSEYFYTLSLVPKYGINYAVGVDGLNLLLILIISFVLPPLFLRIKNPKKGYWANLLFIQSGFFLVVSARDLALFYAGWEVMLLPIFTLIGIFGKDEKRVRAAFEMMYYAIFGSMVMLGAIIYLGATYYLQNGAFSFLLSDLVKLNLGSVEQSVLFFCFMLAFAIKIPLFPFHLWMAKAYTTAPTSGTFMLSVVASKVAILAILTFVLPLFPNAFIQNASLFVWLGIFSMLYFGVEAFRQRDFKTLLAYASGSHLGLILAAIFSLNLQGWVGLMYQIVAHAMSSGMMFLLVGIIAKQLGTRDCLKLGGLAIKAPVFALFFAIAMVSSVGLPSTIGFVSEFLMLLGLFKANLIYGAVATLSIIIGAAYMFVIYRKAILQSTNELTASFKDLSVKESVAFLIPIVLIFVLGLAPNLFLNKIEPGLQNHYETYIKPNLGGEK